MPGTAFPEAQPWCFADNCPPDICGGPHVKARNPATGQEATFRLGGSPPPGFTELVDLSGQAEAARKLQAKMDEIGAGRPQAPASLELLDTALASAREHQRLGDAAMGHNSHGAAAHYLGGILELGLALGAIIQSEAT